MVLEGVIFSPIFVIGVMIFQVQMLNVIGTIFDLDLAYKLSDLFSNPIIAVVLIIIFIPLGIINGFVSGFFSGFIIEKYKIWKSSRME